MNNEKEEKDTETKNTLKQKDIDYTYSRLLYQL